MGAVLTLASVGFLLAAVVMSRRGAGLNLVRGIGLRVALATPLAAVFVAVSLPEVAQAAPASVNTWSRYLTTTDPYTLACNQGFLQDHNGQMAAAMILDFGHPDYAYGQYGSDMYGGIGFRTKPQIEASAERAFDAFYNCTVPYSKSFIHFGIGTTNCSYPYCGPSQVNSGHGSFWESIVNDLNNYMSSHGYHVQEDIYGANDIEPSWSSASNARAWVGGFASGPFKMWDYGSADGCPQRGYPQGSNPGSCSNSWTQDDVFYVSYYAAPSYPWPEIYVEPAGDTNPGSAVQAYQWQLITLYAYLHIPGYRMQSWAGLSQLEACYEQNNCSSLTMNTPTESWSQLYNALNSDSRTAVQTSGGWMQFGGQMSYSAS